MEVNLYKRTDSKFYWVSWTENGKLKRKSTKCKLKKDAQKVVDKMKQGDRDKFVEAEERVKELFKK